MIFGIVLALATVGAFVGIAAASASTPTGNKVQSGDNVFVPPSAVAIIDPNSKNDAADLARFMAGFLQGTIKITKVTVTPGHPNAIGSIIGLTPAVQFPLANVTLIERNGQTFA